jgi:ABC-type multidrug transport system ATPase subunit
MPRQLSGGERRKVELALALVRRPLCLIADEPLRGIDPKDREELVSILRRLARVVRRQ